MVWNVYTYDINRRKMEVYNIFNHYTFKEYVDKWLKECETKEELAEHLKSELRYYFGFKCEWEILISPWIGNKECEEKIDVRDQVMLNFDVFVDYVWSYKEK